MNETSQDSEAEASKVLTGIPKTMNADILLGMLEEYFFGCYDYFYLPMDQERLQSTGLAYINFRDHDKAVECQRFFSGFTAWPGRHSSERTCRAQWSSIQGFEANIEKQRKQNWLRINIPESCKPMVFDEQGTRLPTMDIFPDWGDQDERGGWANKWYGGSSKREIDQTSRHPGGSWSNEWRSEEFWQKSALEQNGNGTMYRPDWRWDRNGTWDKPAPSWKSESWQI